MTNSVRPEEPLDHGVLLHNRLQDPAARIAGKAAIRDVAQVFLPCPPGTSSGPRRQEPSWPVQRPTHAVHAPWDNDGRQTGKPMANTNFKDHFSSSPEDYAAYRPVYP